MSSTPIWRTEISEKRIFGDFKKVEEDIIKITQNIGGIKVISGYGFIPESTSYFADLRLHPNDEGFKLYFDSLYSKVSSKLIY